MVLQVILTQINSLQNSSTAYTSYMDIIASSTQINIDNKFSDYQVWATWQKCLVLVLLLQMKRCQHGHGMNAVRVQLDRQSSWECHLQKLHVLSRHHIGNFNSHKSSESVLVKNMISHLSCNKTQTYVQ